MVDFDVVVVVFVVDVTILAQSHRARVNLKRSLQFHNSTKQDSIFLCRFLK